MVTVFLMMAKREMTTLTTDTTLTPTTMATDYAIAAVAGYDGDGVFDDGEEGDDYTHY